MCSNLCGDEEVRLTPFQKKTIQIRKKQKIEKFLFWFLFVPAVVGFMIAVGATKYFDANTTKSFYAENVKTDFTKKTENKGR